MATILAQSSHGTECVWGWVVVRVVVKKRSKEVELGIWGRYARNNQNK